MAKEKVKNEQKKPDGEMTAKQNQNHNSRKVGLGPNTNR